MAAGFKYDRGAGIVTVTLPRPLRRVEGGRYQYRRARGSMDGTVIDVVTVGSALEQIWAEIRPIDPTELLDLLEAGADGYTLTYYPDLGIPGVNYPLKLLSPSGATLRAQWDRDSGVLGHAEQRVLLRRVDGGSVENILTP